MYKNYTLSLMYQKKVPLKRKEIRVKRPFIYASSIYHIQRKIKELNHSIFTLLESLDSFLYNREKRTDGRRKTMRIDRKISESLIREALAARKMAYTPYSHFQVGAALLCPDGSIYRGCNVENAAYTPTNCAERTAFFKAVSEGQRNFTAIAIVGGPEGSSLTGRGYCAPCGVCRQVMMEFCSPAQFVVILARSPEDYREYLLEELLPMGFGPGDLVPEQERR